jgi:hypothetical protein
MAIPEQFSSVQAYPGYVKNRSEVPDAVVVWVIGPDDFDGMRAAVPMRLKGLDHVAAGMARQFAATVLWLP